MPRCLPLALPELPVLRLFRFVFAFFCFDQSRGPSFNHSSSFLDMHAPRRPHAVTEQLCMCPLLSCFFFVSWKVRCRFCRVLCIIMILLPFYLTKSIKSTLYVFLLNGVILPYNHGLDFDISAFMAEFNQINQWSAEQGKDIFPAPVHA